MRKKLLIAAICFSLRCIAANNELPLDIFVKEPNFQQLVLSPTGQFMAASMIKDDGTRLVAVFDLNGLTILSQIEFVMGQIPSTLTWLNDQRIGMRIAKQYGRLDYPVLTDEYYAMNADGTKKANLWGLRKTGGLHINPEYSIMRILHLLPEKKKRILVTEQIVNQPEPSYTQVYELDIYSGKKYRVTTAPIRGASVLSDHNANVRFAIGTDPDKNNDLTLFYREENGEEWQLLDRFNPKDGGMVPVAFSTDNRKVYALSTVNSSTEGLVEIDLASGERKLVYRHPQVDIDNIFATQTMKLVSAQVSPDYTINVPLTDHPLNKWLEQLQLIFKQQTVEITSTTKDNRKLIVRVSSARKPPEFYLFDVESKTLRFLVSSRSWIDPDKMAHVKPINVTARDGVALHGYLTLPNDKTNNLPLIVYPHGGPHGPRDFWQFNTDAQVLASRGYAVLQINFRGSGGYGRDFLFSGYGEWGLSMQDDVTDATQWAIEQGIADADRICIYGASYGGYASLMATVKEPELYQCAVGYVGVYSLPMMFQEGDIPDSKFGVNYLKQALGDDKQSLKERSPAYNVEKIQAAIMLVHGRKDQRVPIAQAEFLAQQLDDAGKQYEWFVEDKEGHGFYKPENRLALYEKLLTFFDLHIGNHD